MKKILFFVLITAIISFESGAQLTRYVVEFKNKAATVFTLTNPSAYLSQRAITRRTRYNISIDSTDLPIPVSYISQIQAIPNLTVLNISKWLNAVTIQTSDAAAITALSALPFVKNVAGIAARPADGLNNRIESEISSIPPIASRTEQLEGDFFDYGTSSFNEIHLHQGEFLHNIGLRGQGMQVAILDGGFFNYTTLRSFDSVNANGQIMSTWDFVARHTSVAEDHPHGMMCLSIMAANIPGQFIGKSPKASFHLFRTEDAASEYPIEEFNWACGAERADSIGVDVISSSLGYGYQFNSSIPDYPQSVLNGDITMSSRAADFAAKKGLLVFNAAGNSGSDYWHTILTPADADSVVAVGAVNTAGVVGGFSSYGPSADGRIKPDVASIGVTAMVQTTGNTIGFSNGTSYACPNMAGLTTCLWQGFPEFNNMRIVRALKEAGHIYLNPDNRTGYGIPNLRIAFTTLLKEFATTSSTVNTCQININWTSKDVSAMKYEIERKGPNDLSFIKVSDLQPAAGTVLNNHSYQTNQTLTAGSSGIYSYRIRQIVDTAQASFTAIYLDTIDVNLSTPCLAADIVDKVLVAPNPVTGASSIIIETGYAIPQMNIRVFDMKGALVLQMSQSKLPGKSIFNLPAQRLMPGAYILKVYNEDKSVGQTSFVRL